MAVAYDERRVSFIANEVSEAIEQASYGRVPWTVAADLFSSAFPGGFAALINQDFIHDSINFMEWVGLDQRAAATYVEHFAYINPWADIWTEMQSGSVFVAERHRPAKTFVNTEFYNDWLAPQGDVVGGVGLKVDASPTDVIYFPMHYPSRLAEVYDHPAAMVSRRLVGVIERAIQTSRDLMAEKEDAVSRSAIVDRGWPAIVVDSSMRLRSANRQAESLLAAGQIVRCAGGRISFENPVLGQEVDAGVRKLSYSAVSQTYRYGFHDEQGPVFVSLSRLPTTRSFVKTLVTERAQILIRIKRPLNRPERTNLSGFGEVFGLTPSEVALCAALDDGLNLQDAAVELGLTYETVRQRTKIVFQKTGVRSQSALCALLARYAE
jgi:DNA-binding CsgD family transcriptional regulator